MTSPALHTVPVTRVDLSRGRPDAPSPFRVLNGAVYFSGQCESCRPFCGSVCCRGYAFVSLTEEEAQSGLYVFKEAEEGCDCVMCTRMRDAGVQYALYKRSDGACFYLDGTGRCSIYHDRPETCRKYSCTKVAFRIVP